MGGSQPRISPQLGWISKLCPRPPRTPPKSAQRQGSPCGRRGLGQDPNRARRRSPSQMQRVPEGRDQCTGFQPGVHRLPGGLRLEAGVLGKGITSSFLLPYPMSRQTAVHSGMLQTGGHWGQGPWCPQPTPALQPPRTLAPSRPGYRTGAAAGARRDSEGPTGISRAAPLRRGQRG